MNLINDNYIGGNFSSDDIDKCLLDNSEAPSLFYNDLLGAKFFETASDGIAAIINEKYKRETIRFHFPDNFCQSTISVIEKKANCKLDFIRYKDIAGLLENRPREKEFLLIVHFNGVYNNVLIEFPQLLSYYVVIEDFVQLPFHIHLRKALYAVNSMRKILPLELSVVFGLDPKTSYCSDVSSYFLLKKYAAKKKADYFITGNSLFEQEYLEAFLSAENKLLNNQIYLSQPSEVEKLHKIDFEKIYEERKLNYNYLYTLIAEVTEVEIIPGEYMFMMILVNGRDALREFLFDKGIFCAIHWADSNSEISKNLLSIPIDQRYDKADMYYIACHLKQFFTKNE